MIVFMCLCSVKIFVGVVLLSVLVMVIVGCSSMLLDELLDGGGLFVDFIFKLGLLLLQIGLLLFFGLLMEFGVGFVVKEVNDVDVGVMIELIVEDEGDIDMKVYEILIIKFQSVGVSVIVGVVVLGVFCLIFDGNVFVGILQIFVLNIGFDFIDWDDNGFYFCIVFSDLLQGEVFGNLIVEDGYKMLGVIYQNDVYGMGLFDNIKLMFEGVGGEVVVDVLYNVGDGQFDVQVEIIKVQNFDVVVIVLFDQFKIIVLLLVNVGILLDKFYLVDGNLLDYGLLFDINFLFLFEGVQGIKFGLVFEDDFIDCLQMFWMGEGNFEVNDFIYVVEVYDVVVFVVFVFFVVGLIEGVDIVVKMVEVFGGFGDGEKCISFVECVKIINDGGIVDYDGYFGEIMFDENGDLQGVLIGMYVYGVDNLIICIN